VTKPDDEQGETVALKTLGKGDFNFRCVSCGCEAVIKAAGTFWVANKLIGAEDDPREDRLQFERMLDRSGPNPDQDVVDAVYGSSDQEVEELQQAWEPMIKPLLGHREDAVQFAVPGEGLETMAPAEMRVHQQQR
jgi:hypothetical protein